MLTVYAAGYWRTRDEARRLETQAQARRPAHSPPPVAVEADPPIIAPPVAAATPAPVAAPSPPVRVDPPSTPPVAQEAKPAAKAPPPAKTALPPPPAEVAHAAPAAPPAILSVPIEEPLEARAPATPATASASTPADGEAVVEGWRDGTYTGWGYSNHGDIEAQVVIENGRIVGSGVARCATRYPCDVIDLILLQPVQRQSPDVDKVSRATESADAYYYGLVEALKKAEAPVAAATPAK